jgi:RNA polymerase sigma factor (sigma-70 family)
MGVPVNEVSPDGLDEAALVERARGGDIDAFGALVHRHRADAYRLAYFITGSRGDAEDAAQEGFVKAYMAISRFRPNADIRPWLLRIVANESKNRRRSSTRRERREQLAMARDPSLIAPPPASPEETALGHLDAERLSLALAALGDRDQLVVGYRYFAGLSEAEMAVVLGCAPGTVKSRLARALGRLRESLSKDDGHV